VQNFPFDSVLTHLRLKFLNIWADSSGNIHVTGDSLSTTQ